MNTFLPRLKIGLVTAAAAVAWVLASATGASAQLAVGVANVSVADGNVVIIRGDSGIQTNAVINAPVMTGDYLAVGGNSAAEVQFDGITALRMASNSQVRFINLAYGSREVQVASGTVELADLQGIDGGTQLDTPSVTVRPNQSGDYRVSVLGNGQTLVTVRSGSATVASAAGSQTLTPGSTLVASGPYQNPSITMMGAIAYDSFDNFNAQRDQIYQTAYNSNPYLAPQLAGYTNFGQYGSWSNVPGYGEAWAPYNQGNGWAPYQNGQFVWEPGYGYTWVGNEPWGSAPYHYGNWFANNNQWYWQPPSYQAQTSPTFANTWLPALVAFFLSGSTNSYNPGYGGFGNVGWVPLAPGEPYQPWFNGYQQPGYGYGYGQPPGYGYPPTSITTVNNYYYITRNYRNIRYYPVRMYPINRFRAGQFAHPIVFRPGQLTRVAIVRGALPVVPTVHNLQLRGVVRHRVLLAKQFRTAPRFVQQARKLKVVRFTAQQMAVKHISAAPIRHVALPKPVTSHPVYRPVLRRTPVMHPVVKAKPVMHPVVKAKPVMHPVVKAKPVYHPAPKPVYHPAPHPVYHPAVQPKPVYHPAAQPKPVYHPAPKPVYHPAPHPVYHPAPHPAPQNHSGGGPKPKKSHPPVRR